MGNLDRAMCMLGVIKNETKDVTRATLGACIGIDFRKNHSEYNDHLELNLGSVQASLAGPKRPQDRINLNGVSANFQKLLQGDSKKSEVKNHNYQLTDGDVVIAAITSCTNTSNPNVLVAAGLVAKKASELGMLSVDFERFLGQKSSFFLSFAGLCPAPRWGSAPDPA